MAYGVSPTVVVIDRAHSGHSVREIVPHLQCDAPIVASFAEAKQYGPTALLIGIAPGGGELPPDWRAEIVQALESGLEIVNGLHLTFADDEEFKAAALRGGGSIWDVREPPESIPLFSGAAWETSSQVLLTVGSDCAVGKMTVALELARAARDANRNVAFVPTGQTGIMIAGWGISIDRVISDFAAGAAEQLVLTAAPDHDLLIVEGQGSISHPAYAPVTLALLYGSAPDALLLVHDLSRSEAVGFPTPIRSYSELIHMYEFLCSTVKPARVVGIALNTSGLSPEEAQKAINDTIFETGLPCDDVVRNRPHNLWRAIAPALTEKTRPVRAEARVSGI